MISVITACYGGYDTPWPLPAHEEICATFVSDQDLVSRAALDNGWTNGVLHEIPHVHPRLAAKVAKCDPMRFMFDCPHETIVWLDASARITDIDRFVDVVKSVSVTEPMAQFVHPDRDDVEDEAKVSATMEKYQGQKVGMQAWLYRHHGLPAHWGLWATGMIVYHPLAFDIQAFGNAWLAEQLAWTYQDQISEPYLLWKADYKPRALPGHLRDNGFVDWMPHTRSD
jgi:hypothetical protein